MKLNIVPARAGLRWVKMGIATFFRQPLALSGLFFMFMAMLSVATILPFFGVALALALLPAATLGMMAATEEAAKGKFPTPSIVVSAFRAGRERMRDMAVLGALYAVGFLTVMGTSALVDGGNFAQLYLTGGKPTQALVQQDNFQLAMWVAMALYLPLSLLFWHAPALVHWHGITPVKSLFFSFVACYKNLGALTLFGLAWSGVFMVAAVALVISASMIGEQTTVRFVMFPVALVIATMFFTSLYFSFRDCFLPEIDGVSTVQPVNPNGAD